MKQVTKEMSFAEIVQNYPEAVQILFEKGMHCIGCGMAAYETLEQGAMIHGIDADKLVEEINSRLNKKKIKIKKKAKKIKKKK